MSNCFVKFDSFKTCALVIATFKDSNTDCDSEVRINDSFFNNSVKAKAISA